MKVLRYISLAAVVTVFSCVDRIDADDVRPSGPASSSMDVLAYTGTNGASVPTRSLVQALSSATLEANFLRIDGENPHNEAQAYPPLSEANIIEADMYAPSVFTGSGRALRGISFKPQQDYVFTPGTEGTDTVFTKTRMVAWYPKLWSNDDYEEGVVTKFKDIGDYYYENGDITAVTFKNRLDGQTDIMVSDMREGMHKSKAYYSHEDNAVPPFGYDPGNPDGGYSNFFTFRHYLTAVKVYVKCDVNDLSLMSWGQINSVVFLDQPSTVSVELPDAPGSFGSVVDGSWKDFRDMHIITTPIYGESGETVSYPVKIADKVDGILKESIYLGYIMLQPDKAATLELHTDAGVFQLEIPVQAGDERLLEAGKIYNINIEITSDGKIGIFLKNDDDKTFKDLSPWNIEGGFYETANSYLINTKDDLDEGGSRKYDGYFFNAMQAGNGERGELHVQNRKLYPADGSMLKPASAGILFQTRLNTVRNVELVGGYVRFELNEACYDDNDPLQANAVIAVYDENGDVLWSWLIWVTREAKDIEYAVGDRDITMLNMNLGANRAFPENDDPLKTYGLYYQWGRKDPSPRPPRYDFNMRSMETIRFYGPNGEEINYVSEYSSNENTIEDSARNPLLIMEQNIQGPEYAFDWLYNDISSLWGSSTWKTIYDPCPYGYKVPYDEMEQFFVYARSNYISSKTGVRVLGGQTTGAAENFFPFAGWKGYDTGTPDKGHPWKSCGVKGDYPEARILPATMHRASCRVSAADGFDTSKGSNRTSATPVRCVRYDAEP